MSIRINSNEGLTLAQVGFEIGIAVNGFIFGEYDVSTDSHIVKIAVTTDELEVCIRQWLEDRINGIKIWAEQKRKV